ncbi:FAD-binding oxidoreductase [Methylocystis heyeri]|uniref:FAD-binding protein n=1 Tax=Methylocystis heyeri TaxID=391905 RepID=A0A6B8KGI7_9HYPH|nr:FAD-binding oxidoreductase [Methylocystis heyeri]QGM46837.1 FAD-binding protein [Methylocystis heyeri]
MDLLARLASAVGEKNVLAGPDEIAAYAQEPRGLFQGRALAVVKPANVAQVSQVLALCNESGTGVVPQGGNTGLVGGQTPDASGLQIILSLLRLDRIRDVDPLCDAMTLEAGVTLARAQEAAESVDRYFPLSLASEGSCTIGGNLATNAGGVHVVSYGSARALALGVEAVLADGRILSTLSKLRKDNTGYDLTSLLIGSEGTLGVITAATMKLFPRPRARICVFLGLSEPARALALFGEFKSRLGPELQAFELMPRIGLDFVLRHIPGSRDPLPEQYPWYALADFASMQDDGIEDRVIAALADTEAAGLSGAAAIASSLAQAEDFWRLRESMSEAQKFEGGSIKHDVSVPIGDTPAFIDEASRAVTAFIPGARPVPFGHMGDGNIHFNVSQPLGMEKSDFLARWDEVNEIVHGIVAKLGGSVSAEHGVGVLKRDLLRRVKAPVALEAMRAIKASLDPKGVLNPGKLL